MKTVIRYSKHIDLVFHVLAHMRVNNASDCYDLSYIYFMGKKKADPCFDLREEARCFVRSARQNC